MKKLQENFSTLIFSIIFTFGGLISAQSADFLNDPNVVAGPVVEIPLAGTIVLRSVQDDFNAIIKNERVIHAPGTNPGREAWQKIKDETSILHR